MSSFSSNSKAALAVVTVAVVVAAGAAAAAAGETIHHIQRLDIYRTPSSEDETNKWYPFNSEQDFCLSVAGILIFLICIVGGAMALNALIKCAYPVEDNQSSPPTAEEKLAQMSMGPTQIFTNGLSLAGAEHPECTICLSEFVEGEGIRVLPKCNHGFHVKCIENWLLNQDSCPTCRTSCLKTSPEKNSPGEDVDVEAANPPVIEMVPQQQQLMNEIDIEAANPPPVTEMTQQQQQQQQNEIDIEAADPPPVTEMVQQQQQQQQQRSE